MALKTRKVVPKNDTKSGPNLRNLKLLPRFTVWCQRSSCVVTGGLYWVLRTSQLLGVAPLQFKRTSGGTWRIRLSQAHSVINNIRILVCSLLVAITAASIYKLENPGSIMRLTSVTNIIMAALVVVFGAASRMKIVVSLLDRVNEIKSTLTRCYIPRIPKTSEKSKVAALCAFFIFYSYVTVVEIMRKITVFGTLSKYIIGINILYYYIILVWAMLTVQFASVAYEVYSTIKLLNDCLLLLHTNILRTDVTISTDQHSESVRAIVPVCNALQDVIRLLDDAFGTGVTVQLVAGCLKIVFGSVLLDIEKYSGSKILEYWVWLNLLLLFFSSVVVVMESGNKLSLETNRTKRLVSQLLSTSPNTATTRELVKFSQCLLLDDWNNSTLKLCVMSRNLIARICGGIATYILMVINFNAAYRSSPHKY